MSFKNFPMVPRVIYGHNSSSQLEEIIEPFRKNGSPFVYFADHYFKGKKLIENIHLRANDEIFFIDTTHEPTTDEVDSLNQQSKKKLREVSGIIGFGGGSVLEIGRAHV